MVLSGKISEFTRALQEVDTQRYTNIYTKQSR